MQGNFIGPYAQNGSPSLLYVPILPHILAYSVYAGCSQRAVDVRRYCVLGMGRSILGIQEETWMMMAGRVRHAGCRMACLCGRRRGRGRGREGWGQRALSKMVCIIPNCTLCVCDASARNCWCRYPYPGSRIPDPGSRPQRISSPGVRNPSLRHARSRLDLPSGTLNAIVQRLSRFSLLEEMNFFFQYIEQEKGS